MERTVIDLFLNDVRKEIRPASIFSSFAPAKINDWTCYSIHIDKIIGTLRFEDTSLTLKLTIPTNASNLMSIHTHQFDYGNPNEFDSNVVARAINNHITKLYCPKPQKASNGV